MAVLTEARQTIAPPTTAATNRPAAPPETEPAEDARLVTYSRVGFL
jgi:hypothetical protein